MEGGGGGEERGREGDRDRDRQTEGGKEGIIDASEITSCTRPTSPYMANWRLSPSCLSRITVTPSQGKVDAMDTASKSQLL